MTMSALESYEWNVNTGEETEYQERVLTGSTPVSHFYGSQWNLRCYKVLNSSHCGPALFSIFHRSVVFLSQTAIVHYPNDRPTVYLPMTFWQSPTRCSWTDSNPKDIDTRVYMKVPASARVDSLAYRTQVSNPRGALWHVISFIRNIMTNHIQQTGTKVSLE